MIASAPVGEAGLRRTPGGGSPMSFLLPACEGMTPGIVRETGSGCPGRKPRGLEFGGVDGLAVAPVA